MGATFPPKSKILQVHFPLSPFKQNYTHKHTNSLRHTHTLFLHCSIEELLLYFQKLSSSPLLFFSSSLIYCDELGELGAKKVAWLVESPNLLSALDTHLIALANRSIVLILQFIAASSPPTPKPYSSPPPLSRYLSLSLLLHFGILKSCNNRFVRAHVECNNRLFSYDYAKSGVVFGVGHEAAVKVVAMSNVFVLYCVSSLRVYVFAVRLSGGEESESVKLIKTGVMECCLLVFSVGVSSRFLVLGEFEGVRVFPMQVLVKGWVKKTSTGRLMNLNHGKVNGGEFDKHSASRLYGFKCDYWSKW